MRIVHQIRTYVDFSQKSSLHLGWHKFGPSRFGSVIPRRVFDGTSYTPLAGEITNGEPGSFQGMPRVHWNRGSPFLGINGPGTIPGERFYGRTGDDFSSYHPGGRHFLRADGSVQMVSENIDQLILDAMVTRAGGEAIEE